MAHDKAGERRLETLLLGAQARLHDEGIAGDVYLFKNNTDSAGNSYGCHENYLVSRYGEFQRFADILIPFLVSRQCFSGAGKVLHTSRGALFCLSQRAEHIWEGVSSATTRSRPIINTRDEPHADAELDWVMKYKVIQGFRERHSLPLGHPRVALVDLAYHDVHRGRGLYYMLEREGLAERMVTEPHVERAIIEAPQTTRARLRAE